MTTVRVRYVADNGTVTGYGALLMGGGTQAVSAALAKKLVGLIALSAAAAETEGRGYEIEPGHVVKAFSNIDLTPSIYTIFDAGRPNPRRSTRVEVTGKDLGQRNGRARSSPVTLEFGSHYNEGTSSDRPALQVMGKALRLFAARRRGVRANIATTPYRFIRKRS